MQRNYYWLDRPGRQPLDTGGTDGSRQERTVWALERIADALEKIAGMDAQEQVARNSSNCSRSPQGEAVEAVTPSPTHVPGTQ